MPTLVIFKKSTNLLKRNSLFDFLKYIGNCMMYFVVKGFSSHNNLLFYDEHESEINGTDTDLLCTLQTNCYLTAIARTTPISAV